MAASMPRIVFTPSGLTATVAARHHRARRGAPAGRRPRLGVRRSWHLRSVPGRAVSVGSFAKWAIDRAPRRAGPPASIESRLPGQRGRWSPRHRLGCAARIDGDVVVDVPSESQVHRQVVRKDLDLPDRRSIRRSRCTTSRSTEPRSCVTPMRRSASIGEARRRAARPLAEPRASTGVLRRAAQGVARATGTATVAVRRATARVVAIWPGFVDTVLGIAVDIGSTTIAGHLCDLSTGEVLASAGRMNPQIRFGEDLMSRVSYVMMNPGGDARADRGGARRARRADRRARARGRRRRASACSKS